MICGSYGFHSLSPFFYGFHGLSTFYAVSMVSMPAPFPWFWLIPLFCRSLQVLSLLFDGAWLSCLTLSGTFFLSDTCIFLGCCGYVCARANLSLGAYIHICLQRGLAVTKCDLKCWCDSLQCNISRPMYFLDLDYVLWFRYHILNRYRIVNRGERCFFWNLAGCAAFSTDVTWRN